MHMPNTSWLARLHAVIVRIEYRAICIPVGIAFGFLGFFCLVIGAWLNLVVLLPMGVWALCVINFIRLFRGETSEKLLATVGMVIFLKIIYETLWAQGLALPVALRPWIGGVWAISIVGIHWIVLAWTNYRLPVGPPRRIKLKRLPDRL